MANSVYEALQLMADIDSDYRHAYHDDLHPYHREAVMAYQELAEWCSIELSKRGSRDYQIGKGAPPPPPLRETRPGFLGLHKAA